MKKFNSFSKILALFIFLCSFTLNAQTVVQSWDFESGLGDWVSGDGAATLEQSSDQGSGSAKMVGASDNDQINIQNDVFDNLQTGDTYSVKVYVSAEDLTLIGGMQFFWFAPNWSWNNSSWIDASTLTAGQWNTVTMKMPDITAPVERIGFQFLAKEKSSTPTVYIDEITITRGGSSGEPSGDGNWGFLGGRIGDWNLNIENGDASIGGDATASVEWVAIRAGFEETLSATESQAVVVTGKMEFVGAGFDETWNGIRYGLFMHNNVGVAEIDTDAGSNYVWTGSESEASGYIFTPLSGTNDQVSYSSLGNGTQGATSNGNWISTNNWSNPTVPYGIIKSAPNRAKGTEGVYNFAISVQPLSSGDNEVRFYLIKEDNSYWYGGTIIDTNAVSTTFNGICFAPRAGQNADLREFKVTDLKAELGEPIEVPEKPWHFYYVDTWGFLGGRIGNWDLTPGEVIGDVSISGEETATAEWVAIRAGFIEPVTATESKAIIVTGKMEFSGAGFDETWNGIRYGLFMHDSAGTTAKDSLADSNYVWSGSESYASGYIFTPHSGTNDQVSYSSLGNGTQGATSNGNWISTNNWSNPTVPYGIINSAPNRAKGTEGVYNFAISVQPLASGDNEVRFYLIKEDNSYWYGGTIIDTSAVSTTFNGICFAPRAGQNADLREFNIKDLKVDLGEPIEVPEKPWQAYYVDTWGFLGGRIGNWDLTPGEVIGDVSISGEETATAEWVAIRGGFIEPVTATVNKAIIVTGKMKFVGAGFDETWNGIRYGLFMHDSAGTAAIDSSADSNYVWSGSESYASGYIFTPHSGVNDQVSYAGNGNGTQGATFNGNWISTNNWSHPSVPLGIIQQAPRRATATEGEYNFAISVQPQEDGSNEIRFYLIKDDESYWYGGTVIDPDAASTTFNGICFAPRAGQNADLREFKISDLQVDMGDPIDVPEPPFESFFVGDWGVLGDRIPDDWSVTSEVVGNVSIGGASPASNWVALRGSFGIDTKPSIAENQALQITGKMELVDGGLDDAASSLRFGLFSSNSAGNLDDSLFIWDGNEIADGYLVLPLSGDATPPVWNASGVAGTFGTIVSSQWISTSGENNIVLYDGVQSPSGAVAEAGKYEFSMWVIPTEGKYDIRYRLESEDGSYMFQGSAIDENMTVESFNSFNIALNSASATSMNLVDVEVDRIPVDDVPVGVSESGNSLLPTDFALEQNYPNPFNPTTTIEFSLPQNSHVKLVVYDALGRAVSELVNKEMNAGYYTTNFNASNLASGVYFYRIEAGEFITTKKLMLLK